MYAAASRHQQQQLPLHIQTRFTPSGSSSLYFPSHHHPRSATDTSLFPESRKGERLPASRVSEGGISPASHQSGLLSHSEINPIAARCCRLRRRLRGKLRDKQFKDFPGGISASQPASSTTRLHTEIEQLLWQSSPFSEGLRGGRYELCCSGGPNKVNLLTFTSNICLRYALEREGKFTITNRKQTTLLGCLVGGYCKV